MKKKNAYIFLILLSATMSSFAVHKFHMAIYQIKYADEKKMLQITSRIHIDDLKKSLEKVYNKKIALENENSEESILLKDYLSKHFYIKVNEELKPLTFLSKEIDGDELVYYSTIKGISRITSLEIYNTILTDYFSEQQNMINITVLGKKNSFVLTKSTTFKKLKY